MAVDFFSALRVFMAETLALVQKDCKDYTDEDVTQWDIEYHCWSYENHYVEMGPAYAAVAASMPASEVRKVRRTRGNFC